MKNKQNKKIIGIIIGLTIGLGVGIALDNIAIGAGMAAAYAAAFSQAFAEEERFKDKKTRRLVSWSMLATSILGCLAFGYIVGDMILGLTAGVGFSFVVGLKWEKLYDERMSSMFSKAARNAFVTINAGLSVTLLMSQMSGPLSGISLGTSLRYVIYLSWAVFLFSWFYHANIRGE